MSIIHLCSIPEFSSDYKDVLSFENEENQQEFMNTKIIMSAETNSKLDKKKKKIVVTEDSVKNSTQPLLLTNKSRKPIVLHAKDIKNA